MSNSFTVNTYSPKDVVLTIGGYQITGWQRITITRATSFYTIKGIRGKHTRVSNTDTSATISLGIIQSVQSNEVLSYIHDLDISEGTGRIGLLLKDNSGKSIFSSDEAYITSYPVVTYSGQFEDRPWTIFCQTTKTYIVAGNQRPQTTLLDGLLSQASNLLK